MSRAFKARVFAVGLSTLGGCVVGDSVSTAQPSPQQRWDRSWVAAAGALGAEPELAGRLRECFLRRMGH